MDWKMKEWTVTGDTISGMCTGDMGGGGHDPMAMAPEFGLASRLSHPPDPDRMAFSVP